MKKLHLFIVKSYILPFILTFFVVLFILLMQFLWKYIDDLVGKGLEWYIIAELMLYTSASLVPMALPLAILLSSIMTFGNLGENYELVALKASGLSLQRIMRPLIITSIIISALAFYFSNVVLPVANLKMGALLWDVTQQKPALNIKAGVYYNGIEGYSIKVKSKDSETHTLEDIIIHDHTARMGSSKLITAKRGEMKMTEDERSLILTLYDGHSYDNMDPYPIKNNTNMLLRRLRFDEQTIRFDLNSFSLQRTDEELFKDHEQMLNLSQLAAAEDTIIKNMKERQQMVYAGVGARYFYGKHPEQLKDSMDSSSETLIAGYLDNKEGTAVPFSRNEKEDLFILNAAANQARNVKAYVSVSMKDAQYKKFSIIGHRIEWHRKFTISIACLILFFVGAPLGAIIRKGGLGMPVVMSVIFFLIYHVLSITGEKMAGEGIIEPYQGMWLATAVFVPIGIFLTYKSTTDSSLFDISLYLNFFNPFKKKD
ncbi:MAG TPA: YjgP/YjgQ family permease [Flavobacteriales bacterium]|nr:YjgP/YjgQ family permease [Flavobacteriales bacterium]HIO73088.1 YjgP/YjgQ family permease [Flavobacteriales bacterium]